MTSDRCTTTPGIFSLRAGLFLEATVTWMVALGRGSSPWRSAAV
jgi:hypothetical protein